MIPVGAFMWYYGKEAPLGWVVCDGARLSPDGYLYHGQERSEEALYLDLYKHIAEKVSSDGNTAYLPDLLQDDIFVGYRKSAVGNVNNAASTFLPQHKHIVPIDHAHTFPEHKHGMNHRHLMFRMRHDGPNTETGDYETFPFGKESKEYSTENKVFGHSSLKYKRKYAFSGNSVVAGGGINDLGNGTQADKHFTDDSDPATITYSGTNTSEDSNAVANGILYPKYIVMLPIIKY